MYQSQNFYPQMNNFNPMMNPQQRMAQLEQQYQQYAPQAPQTPQQQTGIGGKIVDSIDAVKATDIPMDGNLYYFPKADGTEIYVKQWMNNGTTRILTFKPIFDSQTDDSTQSSESLKFDLSDETTGAFMKRFDSLESKLNELDQSLDKSLTNSAKSSTRTKKEAEAQ